MVKWKFNQFDQVMLAEFSVDKEDQVFFSLQQLLPEIWDAKSIKKAPSEVKHYAGVFAKIVKTQKLMSSNIELKPRVMLAWWPWGHGATISIRLFLTDTAPYVAKKGLVHKLTGLFA
jgi:hypothetical protein